MVLLQLVLLSMMCSVALGWLARRYSVPYPIALVVGGALLGFVPKLPQFPFDPQLILVVVLPPILYQAALLTSWTDFKANIRPISLLAIGLVVATTLAVGCALKLVVPSVPWAAAFLLGAIVSPPDAVAATTILSRLNIPRHLVTILEGESLVNDATGLVIYKLAIAAVLTGTFAFADAATQFVLVSAGGVAIGVALAFVFIAIHRRLDDPFIEVMTVLTIPYTAYIAAEAVHTSGVLAVVAAGLIRGRYSPEIVSARMRIMARSVWNVLVFMLNSLIFVLIGVQMSGVMDNLGRYPLSQLLLLGLLVAAVAVVVRFVWVFPAAYLLHRFRERSHEAAPDLRFREGVIIGWCGMRGIVSLAAALALPTVLPSGEPFPARDLIIFLTFSFIAMTLVGQGLTLAPLIRRLDVGEDWSVGDEHARVRAAMSAAALAAVDARLAATDAPPAWAAHLREEAAALARPGPPEDMTPDRRDEMLLELQRAVIKAERAELIRLWRANEISDEIMRHQEEILDYREAQL